MKVKDCMCDNVYCVTPNSTIKDCAKMMSTNHIGCIPVCDTSENVVGLITDRDIILRTIACDKDLNNTPVSEVMTTKVCCCNSDVDIKEAEDLMCKYQIRRLPVVDNNNKIIGIITLGDLAKNDNVNTEEISNTLETICKYDNKNAE